MYEGKNIHYSSFDKKPLCSFSSKVCNQHRLNGYAFCVRHILEDPTAPFRRCSYVAKSSKQTCTQAIPKHEDREYCNNHMQVLGMLPRKEKKLKKEKNTENTSTDVKIPFQDRVKSRFNITKLQNDIGTHVNHSDDPDDPYAFPDPCGDTKIVTTVVQPTTPSSAGDSPSSINQVSAKSPGDSCSSSSSIAKFYPELAEKLEKIKPKTDTLKLSKDKGKDKSSRTMNSLQTRIAQNRIKSKRRGTQESSSQSQSPLHCFGKSPLHQGSPNDLYSGFGNHIDFEKSQKTPPAYNSHFDASPTEPHKSANVPGIELKRPPPSYFRQPFDRISNATSVNSPVVSVEDKLISSPVSTLPSTQIVNHCVPMEIPHGTPLQSLPGISSRIPLPNSLNLDLPPNIAAYLSAVQAKNPYLTGLPSHLLPQMNLQHTSVPLINLNSPTATGNIMPNAVEKSVTAQSIPVTVNSSRPMSQPPPLLSPSGLTHVFPAVCGGSTTTTSVTFTNSTQQIRPPPPPYSSAVAHALNKPIVSSTPTTTNKHSKPLLNVIPTVSMSLMSAKPEKLKHVLSENEVEKKIRSQTAKKYYNAYLKRKIYDHSLLKAGIDSSSEDSSDDERKDLLPWQPKWFSASSDEEGMDEEEDQNDVIRTTKLSLLRSRLRRHCSQSRRAFKGNVGHQTSNTSITQSLIHAARESIIPTVCAINEQKHVQQPKVYRYKRRGLDRRQCLYKNDEEVQCVNPVVPCANHCLKHIMYNIDQQLFDYCTAKTADNVQCCIPVIDNTHELPLCLKHARKALEESYKYEEEEIKPKRPRKKTKPSALTRPPKKGKKKKNQRKLAALQMAMEEATVTSEATEAACDVDMDQSSGSEESDEGEVTQVKEDNSSSGVISESNDQNIKPSSPVPVPVPIPVPVQPVQTTPLSVPQQPKADPIKDVDKNLLVELPDSVLAANLPADLNLNKGLELPLEQASRLLEEQDFQEVLNKIPDDTFDIFSGKNGEPTKEEMDELERHLAAANMDLSFAQQSISSTTDYDEQIRILASILTNQSPALQTNMGNDILNGAIDEQPQEIINAVGSGLPTNLNTQSGLHYQQNQMPQYHQTLQNNQISPLHHSAVINNMAAAAVQGQIHQIGPAQQVGSPGSIHNQQMSPGNNLHLNQMRSVQHGSPLGQVPHHGSPVGQVAHHESLAGPIQHQGSPVSQIAHNGSPVGQTQLHGSPINHVQVRSLHSPSTPNAGSPIPVQNTATQQTPSVHNIKGSGQVLKTSNVLSTTNNLIGHNPVLIRGSHTGIIQHNLQTSSHQVNSVPSSGQHLHVSSIPSSSYSVRLNNTQNTMNTLTLVNSLGHLPNVLHSSPHQQINSSLQTNVHHTINLPHSRLPVNVHSKQSNLGHPTDAILQAGKVLYSVNSNVPASSIVQSHTVAASSGHNTERVQSATHNVSSYQTNQQSQVTSKHVTGGENLGTKIIPVLQQTKLTAVSAIKSQTTGNTIAGASARVAWQNNFDGLPIYQNGYPSHSAQFVNDVNNGKYLMTSAHGIQNCTDSQLLQNITQSLVTAPENQVSFDNPNIAGVNSQRIQLSAQTGTGS